MQILSLNRKLLVWLGVCPTSSNSAWNTLFKINFYFVFLLQVWGLLSSVCFIVKFLKIDLNSVLYAGFHTSAYSSSTYSLLVGYVLHQKIFQTFEKLQVIYDESKFFSDFRLMNFQRYFHVRVLLTWDGVVWSIPQTMLVLQIQIVCIKNLMWFRAKKNLAGPSLQLLVETFWPK